MKRILILIIGFMMLFSISHAQNVINIIVQDNDYAENIVNFDHVVLYGKKHYCDGVLLYYSYENYYYYPFFYDNCWYVRAYKYPIVPINDYPYFRPQRYDYRFHKGYTPYRDWYRYRWVTPSRHSGRQTLHHHHNHHHNRHCNGGGKVNHSERKR